MSTLVSWRCTFCGREHHFFTDWDPVPTEGNPRSGRFTEPLVCSECGWRAATAAALDLTCLLAQRLVPGLALLRELDPTHPVRHRLAALKPTKIR